MKLNIEMHDPEGQLLSEIKFQGITQGSVAITYAYAIVQLGDKADWRKMNAAIVAKWPKGLTRLKKAAWKIVDGWRLKAKASA